MEKQAQPTAAEQPRQKRRTLYAWLTILLFPVVCLAAAWLVVAWSRSRPPGQWEKKAWPNGFGPPAGARTVSATPDTFETLLPQARPGDVLLLADGDYAPVLALTCRGEKGRPITLKPSGEAAVFRNTLKIKDAAWLVMEGLTFDFSSAGEQTPYHGIRLDDSSYCVIQGCTVRHVPGRYGFFCNNISECVIASNEVYDVRTGHGICVFGKSWDVTVRANQVRDCASCGIYFDAYTNPGSYLSGLLVEDNVVARCGTAGGAAFNCSNVLDSLFRNNLLYKNLAGGICFYLSPDDTALSGKPRSLKQRVQDWLYNRPSPDCANNLVIGNTVYFEEGQGRWSFKLRDRSSGFTVYNNIFLGGQHGTISVAPTCLAGLSMDYNLILTHPAQTLLGETYTADNEPSFSYTVDDWRLKGLDKHSVFHKDPAFKSITTDNYAFQPHSPAIDAGKAFTRYCPTDIDGTQRPQGRAFDCGAYEFSAGNR